MPTRTILLLAALLVCASARVAAAQSPLASYDAARARLAIADFDGAAALFEGAASATGARCDDDALEQAARLRMALDQLPEATLDVARHRRLCARRRPDVSVHLALRLAGADASHDDWREALHVLAAAMPSVDRTRSVELRAVVRCRVARLLEQGGDRAGAQREYAAVLRQSAGAASGAMRWSEEGRDAVAYAGFAVAERAREREEAVELPAYRGAGDWPSLRVYWRKVGPPFERKRAALLEAEAAYLRVLGARATFVRPLPLPVCPPGAICLTGGDASMYVAHLDRSDDPLDPAWKGSPPSARWAVASAARIGALWSALEDSLRRMPSPVVAPGPAYIDPVDPSTEEPVIRARSAFRACLRWSTAAAIVDADTSTCDLGLGHVDSTAPSVEEIEPVPRLPPAGGPQERPAPVARR